MQIHFKLNSNDCLQTNFAWIFPNFLFTNLNLFIINFITIFIPNAPGINLYYDFSYSFFLLFLIFIFHGISQSINQSIYQNQHQLNRKTKKNIYRIIVVMNCVNLVGNVLTAGVRRFSALSKEIYVQAQNNLFFTGIPGHNVMKWLLCAKFIQITCRCTIRLVQQLHATTSIHK